MSAMPTQMESSPRRSEDRRKILLFPTGDRTVVHRLDKLLDGVQYCFDETGHPRTGTYQEDGKVWELDSDGRVKNRLNGWKKRTAS